MQSDRKQRVIPGRREAANPESRNGFRASVWIPGSRFQRAPE
jgi:hypothetical protein